LEGIKERTKKQGKRVRRIIGGWSFYELQTMTEYKAKLVGVSVVYVDASYTSKTCNECGQIGSRKKHIFRCKFCGNIADAEINAARNIALRGASVNRAEVAC
jgi:putative transposase